MSMPIDDPRIRTILEAAATKGYVGVEYHLLALTDVEVEELYPLIQAVESIVCRAAQTAAAHVTTRRHIRYHSTRLRLPPDMPVAS